MDTMSANNRMCVEEVYSEDSKGDHPVNEV